jgi:hypothetical protein
MNRKEIHRQISVKLKKMEDRRTSLVNRFSLNKDSNFYKPIQGGNTTKT